MPCIYLCSKIIFFYCFQAEGVCLWQSGEVSGSLGGAALVDTFIHHFPVSCVSGILQQRHIATTLRRHIQGRPSLTNSSMHLLPLMLHGNQSNLKMAAKHLHLLSQLGGHFRGIVIFLPIDMCMRGSEATNLCHICIKTKMAKSWAK